MGFREYQKERVVKLVKPVDGLELGKLYKVYQEIKPKVRNGEMRIDDPNAPTLYTVIIGTEKIGHVKAEMFEIQTMKKVEYKGGWGSPHFAVNWYEEHKPLKKGGVYDVVAEEKLQTLGIPEKVYELRLADGEIVKYANSAHFKKI